MAHKLANECWKDQQSKKRANAKAKSQHRKPTTCEGLSETSILRLVAAGEREGETRARPNTVVLAIDPEWSFGEQAIAGLEHYARAHPKLMFYVVNFWDTQQHFGLPQLLDAVAVPGKIRSLCWSARPKLFTARVPRRVTGSISAGVIEGEARDYGLTKTGEDHLVPILEKKVHGDKVVGVAR